MCFMKIFRSMEAIQENHRLPKINHKCLLHSCKGSVPTSPCHPSHSSQLAFNLFEQRCIECAFGLYFTFLIVWRCLMEIQEELKIHGALYVTCVSMCHNWHKVQLKGEMYWFTWLKSPVIMTSGEAWSSSSNSTTNNLASLHFSALPSAVWLYPWAPLCSSPCLTPETKDSPWDQTMNNCLHSYTLTPSNLINSMEEKKKSLRNYSKGFLPFQ